MYVDDDNVGRRWVNQRDVTSLQDPVRKAAETLAKDVETYLYDAASDLYRRPDFLAVAVQRYDHLRTGSGNYAQLVGEITEATIEEAHIQPFAGPVPAKPGVQVDAAVRLSADAREMLDAEADEEDDA